MKHNEALALILEKLSKSVAELPVEDLEKVVTGSHSIEVKIIRNRNSARTHKDIEEFNSTTVIQNLEKFSDRTIASDYLRDAAKNKRTLELLARNLDIALSKQDKTEDLINKIIESTVGARLRSSAIRGHEA